MLVLRSQSQTISFKMWVVQNASATAYLALAKPSENSFNGHLSSLTHAHYDLTDSN